jgi:hypothetical protein
MDQKSSQNEAWMMWKTIDAVSTRPAIQCHVTHANRMPTIGRNAVNSSTNIDAAITQWNNRAVSECLSILFGSVLNLASSASVSAVGRLRCADRNMYDA